MSLPLNRAALVSGLVLVLVLVLAGCLGLSVPVESKWGCGSQDGKRQAPPPDQLEVTYDWQGSNPVAFAASTLEIIGYEAQEAIDLASDWADSRHVYVHADPEAEVSYDWKNTNIFATVMDVYEFAGRQPEEAAALSAIALRRLGIGPSLPSQGDKCIAYKVTLVYCVPGPSGPQKKITTRMIEGSCWENIKLCPQVGDDCEGNDIRFYTVTLEEDCPDALAGSCVWLGSTAQASIVDCDKVDWGCGCIVEADPDPDCSEIEQKCGPRLSGPAGCPSCD